MKRAILLLSVVMLTGCVLAQPTSGKCGKNVTWMLQDDGTLVLSGAGDTYDYSKKPQNSPFVKNGIADRIKVVDLTHFHTDGHLGDNLFYGCRFLGKLLLRPSQDKMLSKEVFSECTNLTTIEYANNTLYSSKNQNNYYKIMQNAIHVEIPTVTKRIVPATTKKEEELFKPLEPFPPIESYDNLKLKSFSSGNHYGQWVNGNWNGVVKTTWNNGTWRIAYFKEGELINSTKIKCKKEYHYNDGTWYVSSTDNRYSQEDVYNSDTSSLPYQFKMFRHQDSILQIKRVFYNRDYFIGSFKNKHLFGNFMYCWANGSIFKGDYQRSVRHNDFDIQVDFSNRWYNIDSYWFMKWQTGKGIFYNPNTKEFQCGLWDNGEYTGSPEIITLQDFFDFPKIIPLDIIAKYYVEKEINEWQKKDEFETTAEWQIRVTEATRQQKANELYVQLQNDYIENYAKKINLELQLGRYDADNRTYLVTDTVFGKMIVTVENITPQAFKAFWTNIVPVPTYFINGNTIDILEMDFMLYDSLYRQYERVAHYQKTADLTYQLADIEYHFEPFTLPHEEQLNGNGKVSPPTYTPYTPSDVDINIPLVNKRNDNTFVYIIANEKYINANNVPYALNDGRTFKKYCEKTLGILPEHIYLYENATFGNISACIAKMKEVGEVWKKDANFIFYYAGHAFTVPGQSVYLLPVDGDSKIITTAYNHQKLLDELGNLPVNAVTCFIDACYVGKVGRGIVVEPEEDELTGNVILLSASSENETAYQYSEKKHGLFTYYLLKKLQDTKGDVTIGELSDYIIKQVMRTSVDVNGKLQTPKPSYSIDMEQIWRNMKL